MGSAKGLDRNTELDGLAAVRGVELVVLQLDHIALLICDHLGDADQRSRLVGKQDGDREDPVSHDQTVLNDGSHRDDIHVAA